MYIPLSEKSFPTNLTNYYKRNNSKQYLQTITTKNNSKQYLQTITREIIANYA